MQLLSSGSHIQMTISDSSYIHFWSVIFALIED